MKKIINNPDCPIDFILGGAKNFRIGGGMQSLRSSCIYLELTTVDGHRINNDCFYGKVGHKELNPERAAKKSTGLISPNHYLNET